jgi:hypothetical protein
MGTKQRLEKIKQSQLPFQPGFNVIKLFACNLQTYEIG